MAMRIAFALALAGSLMAPAAEGQTRPLNARPGVSYLGSGVCAGCHAELYREWRSSAMGRSLRPATIPEQVALAPNPVTVADSANSRFYEVAARDGSLVQTAYGRDASGAESFRVSHPLEWVVGSGVNGFTYIVRKGPYLFQAPLSYYSRTRRWDLSPGYEFADQGFHRPIGSACAGCHAGRPKPVDGRPGRYAEPPFAELSVGCENCHGPGQLHVAAKTHPKGQPDPTIVNPARLEARLAEQICMRCHQGGDARVPQPGRDESDFRPGVWLHETLVILKAVPRSGAQDSDVLEHHALMQSSRCFAGSNGRLSCLTCHPVHNGPPQAPAARAAFFRDRCLTCHTGESCRLTLSQRGRSNPPDDCAGCHMPKRDTAVISHSALTNHRIVRRPGDPPPAPELPSIEGVPPGLEYVNAPPSAPADLPPYVLFRAYGEMLGKYPQYVEAYSQALDAAARAAPDDPLVLASLGRKALLDNTPASNEKALRYLGKAIEQGSSAPSTFEDLAEVQSRAGQAEDALATLRKGVEAAPYEAKLRKLLTLRLIQLKRYSEAGASLREYVRIFPDDVFMRGLLKQATGADR